jgi:hypothetical protein
VFAYVNVGHLKVNKEPNTYLYSYIIGRVIKSRDELDRTYSIVGKTSPLHIHMRIFKWAMEK